MLDYERILEVFKDVDDPQREVVSTSRGYTILTYDNSMEDWINVQLCPSPEALLDALLDAYESLLTFNLSEGKRDLTAAEEAQIQARLDGMRRKCDRK